MIREASKVVPILDHLFDGGTSHTQFLKRMFAALVLAINTQFSFANSPAIPEDIICRTGNIFTAKVVSVKSYDCHLGSKAIANPNLCSPRDAMIVELVVNRVLRLAPSTSTFNSLFIPKHQSQFSMYIFAFGSGANRYQPLLPWNNVPAPMTDEWLNHTLSGRSFVFLAGTNPFGLSNGPALLAGSTLPTESLPWVESTLQNCKPNISYYQ